MSFRDVGKSVGTAVLKRVGRASGKAQETRGLAVDVLESPDAYLVVFDAPGATSSDVQVRFLDGAVEVRVDRFREYFDDFEMRFPGRGLSLDGRATLPAEARVDASAADATLTRHGTLEVRLPKRDDDEPAGDEKPSGTVVLEDEKGAESGADESSTDASTDEESASDGSA
jgi:HSP20 family molecular chaperone IbpA